MALSWEKTQLLRFPMKDSQAVGNRIRKLGRKMMKHAKVKNGIASVSNARMVIIKHGANQLYRLQQRKKWGKKQTAKFEKKIARAGKNTKKLKKLRAKIDKKIAKRIKTKGPRKAANALRDKNFKLKVSKRKKAVRKQENKEGKELNKEEI